MLTEVIVGSRGCGKTAELIKRSATDGTYIVTATRKHAENLVKQAESMGYRIPFPITLDEIARGNFTNSTVRMDGILVDDMDMILHYVFKGLPIKAVTTTERAVNVIYLAARNKNGEV